MGKSTAYLTAQHQAFIQRQKVFFVATAPKEGFINLSPKGMYSLKVLNENTVIWLNLTGSGNETAAHLLEDKRMTIMMNAFDSNPMILRIYGIATAIHKRDAKWEAYTNHFDSFLGARQIFEVSIERVQTSCGFGVPIMEFKQERTEMTRWAEKKGEDGIVQYQSEKNVLSLNGKPTGLVQD
ncbi:MAG: hypothetical protein ACI8SE_001513 [Bacteroidia bacterium]|jgi:hypothetical protein